MAHEHPHENTKQIEALAELLTRHASVPLTDAQATAAARVVTSMFDLAGKGTLVELKKWVLAMQAAGDYENIDGNDTQAQNCAAEICC